MMFGRSGAAIFVVALAPLVSAYTYEYQLSPADVETAEDAPVDGTFDAFVNDGAPSLVDNGFTEFRIAVEFDLSSIELPVASATLIFMAEPANTPTTIEIRGYAGDGQIELEDFAASEDVLGSVSGSPGSNSLDVTEFVRSVSVAGFSLDESMRSDGEEPPLTNFFHSFQLIVETEDDGQNGVMLPLIRVLQGEQGI